jgi:hypothetical protein
VCARETERKEDEYTITVKLWRFKQLTNIVSGEYPECLFR